MKPFAFLLSLFGWGALLGHCKPATTPTLPGYCYDERLFTAKLVECVAINPADDRPAMRACRARVHASCGFTLTSSAGSLVP